MRFAKKTESCDELLDELTSMLAQGAERIALVEQDNEAESVVTEWSVGRGLATHAIARTVQKLVDRESPFGRLYMLRGYRGTKEIDRVLVDVQSTRAEVVGPAGGTAIEPRELGASAAFTHVMQMNERLMHQLTAGSAVTVTHYGQIVDVMRGRMKEVEDDNGRLRAELRAYRDTEMEREDRVHARQMGHEKAKMAWGTVHMLAPAVLQHLGTHKGNPPNPILQQQALARLFESLTAEQTNRLLETLSEEQRVSFISVYDAYTKLAAAHSKAAASASSVPSEPPAAASPVVPGAAPPPERVARFLEFFDSVDQAVFEEQLSFKQYMALAAAIVDAKQGRTNDTIARLLAWFVSLGDLQRRRLGEALTVEQRGTLAELFSGAPDTPPSDTKPAKANGASEKPLATNEALASAREGDAL